MSGEVITGRLSGGLLRSGLRWPGCSPALPVSQAADRWPARRVLLTAGSTAGLLTGACPPPGSCPPLAPLLAARNLLAVSCSPATSCLAVGFLRLVAARRLLVRLLFVGCCSAGCWTRSGCRVRLLRAEQLLGRHAVAAWRAATAAPILLLLRACRSSSAASASVLVFSASALSLCSVVAAPAS
ncbi:hypothetical protein HBB16_06295 [Pseudonocardia sp. MCCB 268]|nr:hypothetical protein [Pseudonocardia cytotoxica]